MDILEGEWLGVLSPWLPVMVSQPVGNLYTVFSHSGPAHSKSGHLCLCEGLSTRGLDCSLICVTTATMSRDTGCKWVIIGKLGYLAVTIAHRTVLLAKPQMLMAEARSSIEMEPIGSREQYQLDHSSSDCSDREGADDLVGPLDQYYEKGGDRRRTRTCCSVCSCSGVPMWQPPQDPSEINMLDVP